MSLAKIIWAVAILAAIIFAFVQFEFAGLILIILGLAGGFFVSADHRRGVLIAAIFLMAGGSGALGGIPEIGQYLTAILGSYGSVLAAASVMVIIMVTVERLKPAAAS
ncbi:MAG: hypothetical protein KIS81_00920 [Maricaulaceae bacterium]|nr:hypothetical protein [Maricaulaceae bacterium]